MDGDFSQVSNPMPGYDVIGLQSPGHKEICQQSSGGINGATHGSHVQVKVTVQRLEKRIGSQEGA